MSGSSCENANLLDCIFSLLIFVEAPRFRRTRIWIAAHCKISETRWIVACSTQVMRKVFDQVMFTFEFFLNKLWMVMYSAYTKTINRDCRTAIDRDIMLTEMTLLWRCTGVLWTTTSLVTIELTVCACLHRKIARTVRFQPLFQRLPQTAYALEPVQIFLTSTIFGPLNYHYYHFNSHLLILQVGYPWTSLAIPLLCVGVIHTLYISYTCI